MYDLFMRAYQWTPAGDGVVANMPFPSPYEAQNTLGSNAEVTVAMGKYLQTHPTLQACFTALDNGVQGWVYIYSSATSNRYIVPWESGVPIVL